MSGCKELPVVSTHVRLFVIFSEHISPSVTNNRTLICDCQFVEQVLELLLFCGLVSLPAIPCNRIITAKAGKNVFEQIGEDTRFPVSVVAKLIHYFIERL